DEVYRTASLWRAQLAAFRAYQFSACTTCGCRRDYGIGAVSNSISRDASDAAVAFVWSDRRSSLPSNSDATGSRGSDHLGTGAPGAVVRRWASAALLNLRSEEHTSELQSRSDLVCRLLLEKKK